jgi:outer membrane protein OmpA-like peptidoglycan-associated protein
VFEEEFVFETTFEVIRLRRDFGGQRAAQQQARAERVAFTLRFEIEQWNRSVIRECERLDQTLNGTGSGPRRLDPSLSTMQYLQHLLRELERSLWSGQLVVVAGGLSLAEIAQNELGSQQRQLESEPPPPPPRPRQPTEETTSYQVRVVDEVGQPLSGVHIEFDLAGRLDRNRTNAAGIAQLEAVPATSAAASLAEPEKVQEVLDTRRSKARSGKPPGGLHTTQAVFDGTSSPRAALKGGIVHTLVLLPVLGALFVELWDKLGRVRHATRQYSISGPVSFSGTTDEQGRLRHENVPAGNYTLTLTVEIDSGDGKKLTDTYTTPLNVLGAADGVPQTRLLGVVPRVELAQLDLFFNTNKTFLLPTALPAVRKLREIYASNAPSQLLVVGHADTAGDAAYNDQLSLERAEATIAYLKDDVQPWLDAYATSIDKKKRWGRPEDRLMITAMPDFGTKPQGEDAVTWYQRTRGLTVDGVAGNETRKALVEEYMGLDGASLEGSHGPIEAVAHGCGEHFPLDDSGDKLDGNAEDQKSDPIDRRVELFFFDREFGVLPAPPGKNSKAGSPQYPKWRERTEVIHELSADDLQGPRVTFVELVDNLFRTNSAVVLPEGETPTNSGGKQESLTSIGAFATLLRFNDENAGRTLLIAGHCDTTATIEFNQKLSEERAQCALAVLTGDRESFKTLCDARHTVADYKQILSWVARAFQDLTFDCDPGSIDDNAASGVEPVRRFQNAYNQHKQALGATAPDLKPDGAVGKLTWGAFFDCYEFALQQELGEERAGVTALRDKLAFAHPEHKALGFSEHFPIEELGVDHYKSQANRRVEMLLFEPGEEPDVEHAKNDPETSEIYLPGQYARRPVPEMVSARRVTVSTKLVDHLGFPLENIEVVLHLPGDDVRVVFTDAEGLLSERVPPGQVAVELRDGRLIHFGKGYDDYKHDPVDDLRELPTESEGAFSGTDTSVVTLDELNELIVAASGSDVFAPSAFG